MEIHSHLSSISPKHQSKQAEKGIDQFHFDHMLKDMLHAIPNGQLVEEVQKKYKSDVAQDVKHKERLAEEEESEEESLESQKRDLKKKIKSLIEAERNHLRLG